MTEVGVDLTSEPLFSTDVYAVFTTSVPVAVGNEAVHVQGYEVRHIEHNQSNGEFRSFADACVAAYRWTEALVQVRQASSGLQVATPQVQLPGRVQ